MKRTEWLQEARKMRFSPMKETSHARRSGFAAWVCDRTFRRYMLKYDEGGLEALMYKRLSQASHRCAPVDEVIKLTEQYRSRYSGWNAKHFHTWYRKDGGYTLGSISQHPVDLCRKFLVTHA